MNESLEQPPATSMPVATMVRRVEITDDKPTGDVPSTAGGLTRWARADYEAWTAQALYLQCTDLNAFAGRELCLYLAGRDSVTSFRDNDGVVMRYLLPIGSGLGRWLAKVPFCTTDHPLQRQLTPEEATALRRVTQAWAIDEKPSAMPPVEAWGLSIEDRRGGHERFVLARVDRQWIELRVRTAEPGTLVTRPADMRALVVGLAGAVVVAAGLAALP